MSPVTEQSRAMREVYDPQPSGPEHRWPVLRETRPGELLANPPDAAQGVSVTRSAGIAVGLVGLCLLLVLAVHAAARARWFS